MSLKLARILAVPTVLVLLSQPALAMPGGFGSGGFMVVAIAFLGSIGGYIGFLCYSVWRALKDGANRGRWRVVALAMIALTTWMFW